MNNINKVTGLYLWSKKAYF